MTQNEKNKKQIQTKVGKNIWVSHKLTCMILTLSTLWISLSLASFFLSEATDRSRCSLCRAYSFCMSASTLAVSACRNTYHSWYVNIDISKHKTSILAGSVCKIHITIYMSTVLYCVLLIILCDKEKLLI